MPTPGIGIMLPSFDPFGLGEFPVVDAARAAEAAGFDSVWVGDHLSFHPPVMDAIVALSAAAAVTRRVALGTGILLATLRPPALVATSIAGLDQLSGGRVILGLGAGGENPAEYAAVGVPISERGRRLDELIDVLPKFWSGESTVYSGRSLTLNVPPLRPTPVQQPGPPIWIGGRSSAAVRRAALKGDGWLAVWMSASRLKREIATLASQAADAGRATPAVALMAFVNIGPDGARCRAETAELVRGQYGMELDAIERWCVMGGPDELVKMIADARAAGVTGFVLNAASPDWRTQYERIAAALNLGT